VSSALSAPHFHNEKVAYAYVEKRIWPNGPVCPHCGCVDRIGELKGSSTRIGVRKCYDCRKPFTVKVGTIFEASHVKLNLWLQAIHLIASSKKGFSSNQLHRTLGVTLKTAWFMSHRIREAMREGEFYPFGEGGGGVEVDETFIGRKKGAQPNKDGHLMGVAHKMKVLTLLDRNTGRTRSRVIKDIQASSVSPIIYANLSAEAVMLTDEAHRFKHVGTFFAAHHAVNHAKDEYVRYDVPGLKVTTNTIEGFFGIFKRGMRGIYQHCEEQHLHRYMAEYDFRYSNRAALGVDDQARADTLLRGVVGRRLTYETTCGQA
jgi:transposase-like protein